MAVDLGWTISARLRGARRIQFRGLTALQALVVYRRIGGGARLPSPWLDDLAEVSQMLLTLNQAGVQEVTIEGPKGDVILMPPPQARAGNLG